MRMLSKLFAVVCESNIRMYPQGGEWNVNVTCEIKCHGSKYFIALGKKTYIHRGPNI